MNNKNNKSFLIKMKSTKNHTWQGTIHYIEEKKIISFRSMLELIRLIDSAVDMDDEIS